MRTQQQLFSRTLVVLAFLFPIMSLGSDPDEIEVFVGKNAEFILEKAHPTSTFVSSSVKVEELNGQGPSYRAALTIRYKGWLKNHKLVCYTYFDDKPTDFKWISDTNSFSADTSEEEVLSQLIAFWEEEHS